MAIVQHRDFSHDVDPRKTPVLTTGTPQYDQHVLQLYHIHIVTIGQRTIQKNASSFSPTYCRCTI